MLGGQWDGVGLAGGRVDHDQGVSVGDLFAFPFDGDRLCVLWKEQEVGLVNDVLLRGEEVWFVSVFCRFSEKVLGLGVFPELFLFAEQLEGCQFFSLCLRLLRFDRFEHLAFFLF